MGWGSVLLFFVYAFIICSSIMLALQMVTSADITVCLE